MAIMVQEFFTVSEVANKLRLHAKTVLNFVHEGQLKAMRIGKQYRITPEDLAAFTRTATPAAIASTESSVRPIEVSGVLHIDAIDAAQADQIVAQLTKSTNVPRPGEMPVKLDTIYNDELKRLKIIISGHLETVHYLLGLIPTLVQL